MKLVSKEDFTHHSHLDKLKMHLLASPLMELTKTNKINKIFEGLAGYEGMDFVSGVIEKLNIKFQIDDYSLKNIPKSGPFVTVSNYPFGGIDVLVLLEVFGTRVENFKVLNNMVNQDIKPLDTLFFRDTVLVEGETNREVIIEQSECYKHIKSGGSLGIFPAGDVSKYHAFKNKVTDRIWQRGVIKLIELSGVPVVPVYFKGSNSFIYHLLELVHPSLRKMRLPSEYLNKTNLSIEIKIGSPIRSKELICFDNTYQLGRFLRAKTYSLGSVLKVSDFYSFVTDSSPRQKEIQEPVSDESLASEIESLREKNLVFQQSDFEVFISKSSRIPNILQEIGRLREITFREVGEGTGKPFDLDEYDLYYHQLFIWDKEQKKIVGGYRIGKGGDILFKYGVKGFYIRSLFKFKVEFNAILLHSIELGRSFVTKEYQQHRLPLYLLWKGILAFLKANPEYRYLIGPVSISNYYSNISKTLVIQFIKANYYDHALAELVKPKKRFKVKVKDIDFDILLEQSGNDVQALNKVIQDIEPSHLGMPVLLRQYIKQNARIISFNIDPKFANALDGLMILDVNDIPTDTLEDYKI